MAPPKKKGITMSLDEFVGDWADADSGPTAQWNPSASTDLFASVGMETPAAQEQKIPTLPPFTARIGNLSYESGEEDIRSFFRDQKVSEIRVPKNPDQKSKGYAFVEFFDRDSLVSALKMDGAQIGGRNVRVNLEQSSSDFGGRRGGRYQDEPELNWGQRRAPQVAPREFREFREPEDMDWSQRRDPSRAPAAPRMQRDRPPRQFDEPELNWGQRREPSRAPAPQRTIRPSRAYRDEPELNWGQRRAPSQTGSKSVGKPVGKPSGFDVLKGSEQEKKEKAAPVAPKDTAKLADTIAAATSNAEDDSWTTVKR